MIRALFMKDSLSKRSFLVKENVFIEMGRIECKREKKKIGICKCLCTLVGFSERGI